MAKQKDDDATGNIISQLIAQQNSILPGAAVSGDDMFSAVNYWIPTGSVVLDTIISNKPEGGWPAGRTVELYGQESIGKSTLIFAGFAQVQKAGGIAIYFDVEQAGSPEMMRANGVDLSQLVVSNLTSIEEIFKVLEQNLKTIIATKAYRSKPVLICMDSLAQMSTDAEIEADYDFNMNVDLKKARQIGKALRKITPYLNKANACLIIINQLRDAPGVMYGDPTCVDPYTSIIEILDNEDVIEKISFADLAKKLDINLEKEGATDITDRNILIKSYDIDKGIEVFKPMTHFVVKPSVDKYCVVKNPETGEVINTTLHHRFYDFLNDDFILASDLFDVNNDVSIVNKPMQVVDCSVQDTETYWCNGFLNSNTTPGGKAVKFAASVRIKLSGKTPVKMLDPIAQEMYENAVEGWEEECEEWKLAGGNKGGGPKPVKPKKSDYKGDEVTIGYDVIAKTIKNKVGPPDREAEFRIIFTEGIIEEEAWFDYAQKFKIIENENSFTYKFTEVSGINFKDATGEPILFKREDWLSSAMSDVEVREQVKKKITNMLVKVIKGALVAPTKLGDEEEKPKKIVTKTTSKE